MKLKNVKINKNSILALVALGVTLSLATGCSKKSNSNVKVEYVTTYCENEADSYIPEETSVVSEDQDFDPYNFNNEDYSYIIEKDDSYDAGEFNNEDYSYIIENDTKTSKSKKFKNKKYKYIVPKDDSYDAGEFNNEDYGYIIEKDDSYDAGEFNNEDYDYIVPKEEVTTTNDVYIYTK